jgi:hypothetical protein
VRQEERKRIEGKEGRGAHQRGRIWPEGLAEMAESDVRFLVLGDVSGREGKRR